MSPLEQLPQLFANGVVAGAILAVPTIGFTAIYAVLRFPNFAIASHITIGAYAGYVVNTGLGASAFWAVLFTFAVTGLIGAANDYAVLRPFRKSAPLTVAIVSIALNICLENVVRFSFGNAVRGYDLPTYRDIWFAGIRIGPQQIENVVIVVAAMTALFLFLTYARLGKAMRALADNPVLADIKGVNATRVAAVVNVLAMGLAGLGGMLLSLDSSLDPLTGFRFVLSVFAGAVVGGLGSIPGAVCGALVIGIAEEVSLLVLSPAYRTVIGFVAILTVLTLRPRGILGARAY